MIEEERAKEQKKNNLIRQALNGESMDADNEMPFILLNHLNLIFILQMLLCISSSLPLPNEHQIKNEPNQKIKHFHVQFS